MTSEWITTQHTITGPRFQQLSDIYSINIAFTVASFFQGTESILSKHAARIESVF